MFLTQYYRRYYSNKQLILKQATPNNSVMSERLLNYIFKYFDKLLGVVSKVYIYVSQKILLWPNRLHYVWQF